VDPGITVIVCARDEANHLAATLAALAPARVIVADDGSRDATAAIAERAGAEVVRTGRRLGKGGAATLAAARAASSIVVFCDADLGTSAAQLERLAAAVRAGECDLAVGAFSQRGGFGIALRFARWAVRRRCGLALDAPISGQRALSPDALAAALPFAPRFGMEIAMTIDVARAGLRVREYPLALSQWATGRTLGAFAHRGRQLVDFAAVYVRRRNTSVASDATRSRMSTPSR
jgi:glycosyltransferase involved in cell wall biosynthesis